MLKNRSFVAIIPARGGSKRLLRKNVLEIAGEPMISWTIKAARSSKFIDEIVVTTDDREIADVATRSGVAVPFLRPAELATDSTSTFDVVDHALKHYRQMGMEFNFSVLLQPTSPLRTADHIDSAIEYLVDRRADAVISVARTGHPPWLSNTLPPDRDMSGFLTDEGMSRISQASGPYYRPNGAIYICDNERLLDAKTFYLHQNVFAYVMDRRSSIDIDDEFDFLIADLLLRRANSTNPVL